jgi:hypothetical protein
MQKLMYKKCKKEKQCEKYENYYEKHSENWNVEQYEQVWKNI